MIRHRDRRGTIFEKDEEELIASLLKQGKTPNAVARQLVVGRPAVVRVAKRLGLSYRGQLNAALDRDQMVEIVRLYIEERVGLVELAKRYRVKRDRMRAALEGIGIEIRSGIGASKEDAIADDFENGGLSVTLISAKHKTALRSVNQIISRRSLVRKVPVFKRRRWDGRYESTDAYWIGEYGVEEAEKRGAARSKKHIETLKRVGHPASGKPAAKGCGNGWQGWYKGVYFRSLRELSFRMDVLDKVEGQWENGELGKHAIRYVDPIGRSRTYYPDYIVSSIMYEIKPRRLWETPLVKCKADAGRARCAELGMEYVMVDPVISKERVMEAYKAGLIEWMGKTESRFRTYYGLEG